MSFPRKLVSPSSQVVAALAASFALAGTSGCEPQNRGVETESVTSAASASTNKVDILFMVDNSSSMTSMQQKMLLQIPIFIQSLQALPDGLPDLHLAVVSSDMGAPSDQGNAIGCSQSGGDNGAFQNQPRGTCAATSLLNGATFISDNASGTTKNFTLADPAGLSTVFQCIGLLGSNGCGFEHQLASVARALGADGQPAPATNQGFLRHDAELAIVFLTNEDDCSAPADTTLYSLNGGPQSITNAMGPIANYRCNQFGHLCADPTSALPSAFNPPPLNPPADYAGPASAPTLILTNCESNDTGTGLLTPVSQIVAGIKALKAQPSYDIVVSAIIAPATPYTVEWLPNNAISPAEAWPDVEHSCGSSADGSFGDPGVRIAQFVQAFGDNGVTTSICDSSYQPAFQIIASKIAAHLPAAISDAGRPAGGSGGFAGRGDGGTATGFAGTTGSGFAGTTGSGFAGTTGSGFGGTTGSGTGTAGTTGTGIAGTTGTGTAGTTGTGNGGMSGTGVGGSSGVTGAGAAGGRVGAGGHAGASAVGNGGGAGTTLGSGSGCDCQTGGGSTGAWSFTLLIGLFFVRRHRRAALTGARRCTDLVQGDPP